MPFHFSCKVALNIKVVINSRPPLPPQKKRKKKKKRRTRSKTKHREDKEITKNNKHYFSMFSSVARVVFLLALIILGSDCARFCFKQIQIAIKIHHINTAQNKQEPTNYSKKFEICSCFNLDKQTCFVDRSQIKISNVSINWFYKLKTEHDCKNYNKKVKNQTSEIVDKNYEKNLLILTTKPFTIAKSCVPLF